MMHPKWASSKIGELASILRLPVSDNHMHHTARNTIFLPATAPIKLGLPVFYRRETPAEMVDCIKK